MYHLSFFIISKYDCSCVYSLVQPGVSFSYLYKLLVYIMGVSLENYRTAIGVFNNRSRVMYRKPLNILPLRVCVLCACVY